jgi:hypothetical protein
MVGMYVVLNQNRSKPLRSTIVGSKLLTTKHKSIAVFDCLLAAKYFSLYIVILLFRRRSLGYLRCQVHHQPSPITHHHPSPIHHPSPKELSNQVKSILLPQVHSHRNWAIPTYLLLCRFLWLLRIPCISFF